MFHIFDRFYDLSIPKLLTVYEEGIQENGRQMYPHLSELQQFLQAQQDHIAYFREFFSLKQCYYCIWEESGEYVSALRLEPYQDGFLVSGLETAPQHRRKGYGKKVMEESLSFAQRLGIHRIYSHIHRKNLSSYALHTACGFRKVRDVAVYLDGSVSTTSDTLLILL